MRRQLKFVYKKVSRKFHHSGQSAAHQKETDEENKTVDFTSEKVMNGQR